MLLRARIILPVSGPPIENGAVAINGNRITWVGGWGEAPAETTSAIIDLGETIILPGLINAHCHLDYTNLAGKIPAPRSFADWIKSLVALKATWNLDDYAHSWKTGAEMLLRTGATTVADIEAVPSLIPEAWGKTPLRVISFREIIHLKAEGAVATVDQAVDKWASVATDLVGKASDKSPFAPSERIGLSPHAPYTTTRNVLETSANAARARGWPLTTHVAESREEFDMFSQATGALYDWLRPQRDMSDCGGTTPVQHLREIGYLGPDLLAVHVNYLGRDDAAALGTASAHVVHCPRSHAYFGHSAFPFDALNQSRVNICLGTDSLVTVRGAGGPQAEDSARSAAVKPAGARLDLFAEMRAFSRRFPNVPPIEIIRMTTANAARALGKEGAIGALCPAALADLVAVPYRGALVDAPAALVDNEHGILASMIDGRWALAPDR